MCSAEAAAGDGGRQVKGEALSERTHEIDANLYSRQIGAFGMETMGKLVAMKVLITGLAGPGVETAKNLILAGPGEVLLHDDTVLTMGDLGSNFYAVVEDVVKKKTRCAATAQKLAELNDYVKVVPIAGALTPERLATEDEFRGVNVVVASETSLSELIRLNQWARSISAGFIAMHCPGLAGAIFVDFGPEFRVLDADGEAPRSAIVEGITQDEQGTVQLHDEGKPRPFSVGDWVRFREVKGMTEINSSPPTQVTDVTGKYTFRINDTRGFSPYERDGVVEQVKMPQVVPFAPLSECLSKPLPPGTDCLVTPDLAKFGRPEQLFFAFRGLWDALESAGAGADSVEVLADTTARASFVKKAVDSATAANAQIQQETTKETDSGNTAWRRVSVEEVDSELVEKLASFSACRLSPIAAFFGGIAAQEVVKYTGKFTPLRQWLFFDAFEAVPSQPGDCRPMGSRYDHQIAIFGRQFQEKLSQLKIFLVGAGALGCEYLKSLALMGCCCSSGGTLTVTDMDRIEVSNLNRQFLFRRSHVGQSKSRCAATAAATINRDIRITVSETRVGPETEDEFTDQFFGSLDCVLNALDNIPSRLYIDSRCVWLSRPLLESGTLGAKANSQVVLPRRTQSYGDSRDPPEESIPLCTLRHFPNEIAHTIEWARDAFQGRFTDTAQALVAFVDKPDAQLKAMLSEGTLATQQRRLREMRDLAAVVLDGVTYEECVRRAVLSFQQDFDEQVQELLFSFPLDHVTSSGMPFWSGPKRPPTAIRFNADDELHVNFVHSAANLMAHNFGLPSQRDVSVTRRIAAAVRIPSYTPGRGPKIQVDEDQAGQQQRRQQQPEPTYTGGRADPTIKDLAETLRRMWQQIKERDLGRNLTCAEFEKDDPTNFHIDFIHAAANVRARNYNIPECTRQHTLMVAGKIVPAIATTTAMITGLVSLELLKVVTADERPLEDFKNAYISLALPLFVLTEPAPPLVTKSKDYDPVVGGPVRARPEGFSTWDYIDVKLPSATATLGDLVEELERTQKVSVVILAVGTSCLYNSYTPAHAKRREQNLVKLVETVTKKPHVPGKALSLECSSSDATDDVDVVLPTIRLSLV